MKSVDKPAELQNVHAQVGHCERINDAREQSEHDVNTDRLQRGLHLDDCGRGLSINQVQNKSWRSG